MLELPIESTIDVPIPDGLVDQVIGQDAASIVIRKAAEQRRHVIMVGEPGTGKSMLARSMTSFFHPNSWRTCLSTGTWRTRTSPRSGPCQQVVDTR